MLFIVASVLSYTIYGIPLWTEYHILTSISSKIATFFKKFYLCKNALLDTHGEKRNELVDEMINICKCDRENAIETIPLVEFDSRLGYEPSMEYMCDRAHIEWKLNLLNEVIEKELPSYYEN